MEAVPRLPFVPEHLAGLAHRAVPLPIGCGQTTPDPLALGRVLEALAVEPAHRVLEVGTGTGYATALLAALAREVVSAERFRALAEVAGQRLARLGVANAVSRWADGLVPDGLGGRFNRVVVHPGLPAEPEALVGLLAPEGVLIYPALSGGAALYTALRGAGGRVRREALWAGEVQAAIPGRSATL